MLLRAVHGGEPLILKHEVRKHNGALLIRLRTFRIAGFDAFLCVFEYGKIEVDCFLRLTGLSSYKQERRHDERTWFAFWLGQNQLPGHAVFVLDPAVVLAKR